MRKYGSIESIYNNEAKIIMDSGTVFYTPVKDIQPLDLVEESVVIYIDNENIFIDQEETKRRKNRIKNLQDMLFKRKVGDNNE